MEKIDLDKQLPGRAGCALAFFFPYDTIPAVSARRGLNCALPGSSSALGHTPPLQ
jgi:hypothetical protein